MAEGIVFDVQRFCVDDGPGIRTTVFLKGCPLRCKWCHNAEGLSSKIQLYFSADSCVNCASCAQVCATGAHVFEGGIHKIDFKKCIVCGKCVQACPASSLRLAGKKMSVDEVLEEVVKDIPFYKNSGGGMTLSGGEPLMQAEFAIELAKKAKENDLHVAVETSCYTTRENLEKIMPYVDLFLVDFKHHDSEKHLECTGVEQVRILENLKFLSDHGKKIVLRCPIIPEKNDTQEHYRAIAELANSLEGITEVNIEPYHPFGVGKYASVGMEASYTLQETMSKESANAALEAVMKDCKKNVILN